MILSGLEIKKQIDLGRITIKPFDDKQLNPNSYNLKLHNELYTYKNPRLDMKKDNKLEEIPIIIPEDGYTLQPGVLYLGRTVEQTETKHFVPMLEGRSSIGRLGIFIHATAGFGDAGFNGYWTLEISVIQPVKVYPNVDIAQIYYHTIQGDCRLYNAGKYQNNTGIQRSLLFKDFE